MVTKITSWPCFSSEEVQAVSATITSNKVNYWTGDIGRKFEQEYANWTGVHHAIALANGTVALDLALKALCIGPGDEVIVTPRTFIASVSSVVTTGATPVFADVEPDSGNISPRTINAVISDHTKAIIPVHLGGWPCDMAGIMKLANQHDLFVIEDCAQAHGAKVGEAMVGSLGHVGAWSFCQDKIMTTGGEGGMVTTNDEDLWNRMWSYKDHGKSWDAVYNREHPPGFRWVHESFGTNWRMLEMQAAIGRIQLKRMNEWTALRTRNARALQAVLQEFPGIVRVPDPDPGFTHAYYRQYGYIKQDGLKSGWTRDRIVEDIAAQGYPAFQGSCSEVYLEKAFDGTGWRPEKRLPIARELGETSIMLLTHPSITEEQIEVYCNAVRQTLEKATRQG
ncbi:DegT/DnrJ/EryC1/StrS aminotransferase family protein [Parasphingorhabdus sp. JC815]|uniref:DegT/DnrJ/EryC1/StrS family aminotransferase n=1 Tax=Parasphingorhabdus sp. JC815 TaxID=3232140 RepID=UPI003458285D